MEERSARTETIEWHYDVPLLTSRFMVWDFVRVTLISTAISYVLVAVTGWLVDGEPALLPPLALLIVIGVVLALFFLASLLLGNRHGARFTVGPKGVRYAAEQRERTINRVVMIVGALAGSPTTTGAGMIASGQEEMFVPWGEIYRVVYYPGPRVIVLRNTWRAVLRLHLAEELYPQAADLVDTYWRLAASARDKARAKRPARAPWFYYTGLVLAVAAAGLGAQVWYWNDFELVARIGVVGAVAVAASVVLEGPGRRIFGILAIPLLMWHAGALLVSAFESIGGMYGSSLVLGLDPAEFVLSMGSLGVLIGMAAWRAFAPVADWIISAAMSASLAWPRPLPSSTSYLPPVVFKISRSGVEFVSSSPTRPALSFAFSTVALSIAKLSGL